MVSRIKPILGFAVTITALHFVLSLSLGDVLAGIGMEAPVGGVLGEPGTIIVFTLILALTYDWVVQSTGLRAGQAAIVMAVSGIVFYNVFLYMFEQQVLGAAIGESVLTLVFAYAAGTAYGKLS